MRGCWWSGGWDFLDDHGVKVIVGAGRGVALLRGSAEWELAGMTAN